MESRAGQSLVPAEARFIKRLLSQNYGPYKTVMVGCIVKKMQLPPLILSPRSFKAKCNILFEVREVSGPSQTQLAKFPGQF